MTGAFGESARAAIREACNGACVSCGAADRLDAQHRRARGMGGTSNPQLAEPGNGVLLCRVCHGWVEAHPETAANLGWRLRPGENLTAPWWNGPLGQWWQWHQLDGAWFTRWVDQADLDYLIVRLDARVTWQTWINEKEGAA